MKKLIFPLVFLGLSMSAFAQDVYMGTSTNVKFFSESPMENIEAENKKVKTVFKTSTKDLAIVIPILNFKFEKPLMEEHFNENYMESEKFPTATFKGKVDDKEVNLKEDGKYPASATGKLKIHGVEQERTINGTITVKGSQLIFDSKFQIKLVDHDIEIPSVVVKNIAEIIDVTCKFTYEPKK